MFSQFTKIHKQLRYVLFGYSIPRIYDPNLKLDEFLYRFIIAIECILHRLLQLFDIDYSRKYILFLLINLFDIRCN